MRAVPAIVGFYISSGKQVVVGCLGKPKSRLVGVERWGIHTSLLKTAREKSNFGCWRGMLNAVGSGVARHFENGTAQ